MRSATQLLKDSIALYQNNFTLFTTITIVPVVVSILIGYLTGYYEMGAQQSPEFNSLYIIGVLGIVLVTVVMMIAVIKAVASPTTATFNSVYAFARENFFAFVWVYILLCLVVIVGFILLVIPGIIFTLWYSFSLYSVLLDNKKGQDALKDSRRLVKGRMSYVILRYLFMFAVTIAAVLLLGLIGFALGINFFTSSQILPQVIMQLLNIIFYPIFTAYGYFMYVDLKKDKENAVISAPMTVESVVQ